MTAGRLSWKERLEGLEGGEEVDGAGLDPVEFVRALDLPVTADDCAELGQLLLAFGDDLVDSAAALQFASGRDSAGACCASEFLLNRSQLTGDGDLVVADRDGRCHNREAQPKPEEAGQAVEVADQSDQTHADDGVEQKEIEFLHQLWRRHAKLIRQPAR